MMKWGSGATTFRHEIIFDENFDDEGVVENSAFQWLANCDPCQRHLPHTPDTGRKGANGGPDSVSAAGV